MDNLSSHKGVRISQRLEAAGAEASYLPPCSPDLNPIEQAFGKLKHLPRPRPQEFESELPARTFPAGRRAER